MKKLFLLLFAITVSIVPISSWSADKGYLCRVCKGVEFGKFDKASCMMYGKFQKEDGLDNRIAQIKTQANLQDNAMIRWGCEEKEYLPETLNDFLASKSKWTQKRSNTDGHCFGDFTKYAFYLAAQEWMEENCDKKQEKTETVSSGMSNGVQITFDLNGGTQVSGTDCDTKILKPNEQLIINCDAVKDGKHISFWRDQTGYEYNKNWQYRYANKTAYDDEHYDMTAVYEESSAVSKKSNKTANNAKENTAKKSDAKVATTRNISGVVKDATTGEEMPYVNVGVLDSDDNYIKKTSGGQVGMSTDFNGKFSIRDIPIEGKKIKFSYVGYENLTIDISEFDVDTEIILTPTAANLRDVVVVGSKDGTSCVEYCKGNNNNDKCGVNFENVQSAVWENNDCLIDACIDRYVIATDKKNCQKLEQEPGVEHIKNEEFLAGQFERMTSSASDIVVDADRNKKVAQDLKNAIDSIETCSDESVLDSLHAKVAEKQGDKCVPTECKQNYTLYESKCYDAEQMKKIKEAEDNYDAAKAKEKSLANRTLTAATTVATGIGGMELAQGLAEQNADKDAQQDMDAYMQTFSCSYDGGKKYNRGETVELPGGNQLFSLYQEYKNLAADLKLRKDALEMRPGIESEIIFDKADMGLYENKGRGIENGSYASLYRAANGNDVDKTALEEMQETSTKRVKAGAIVAGAGAAIGIVGDKLINDVDWNAIKEKKNNSKENKDKINAFVQGLKSVGMTNTDELKSGLSRFDFSLVDLSNFDFVNLKGRLQNATPKDATKLIDTSSAEKLVNSLKQLQ